MSYGINAYAAVCSGECGANGDNVTWRLNTDTGVLDISGSGEMIDYTDAFGDAPPWHYYNRDIKIVNINNGVTSIGNYAFYSCSDLTIINISDSVTSIGSNAFYNCTSLASITIPNSVAFIGNYAFRNCSGITKITIPNSVTYIANSAFQGCSSLTDVYYAGSEKEWDEINILSYNKDLTNATIHYNYESSTNNGTQFDVSIRYNTLVLVDFVTENLPDTCIIYIAAYKDNVLSQIKQISVDDNGTFFETDGENKFKVFVWDSINKMIPLCESQEKLLPKN